MSSFTHSQHKTYRNTPARLRAYDRLGVHPNDVLACPKISHWIAKVRGGFDFCLNSLRSSSDPVARQFLKFYDDPALPLFVRAQLPVEAFCLAAGISPPALMNSIVVAVQTCGVHMSNLVAALSLPDIVQTSVEQAMTAEGISDREWQLKHASFLPMPKGSQVNVQVNATATAQQATLAPSPEDSIRRLQDHFSESRRTIHAAENASAAMLTEGDAEVLPPLRERELDAMAPVLRREADVQRD